MNIKYHLERQAEVSGRQGPSCLCWQKCEPVCTQQPPFLEEQCKDSALLEVIRFLEEGVLPRENCCAHKLALQEYLFIIIYHTLYLLDSKLGHQKHMVVPCHLQSRIMEKLYHGPMLADFSGPRHFKALSEGADCMGGHFCGYPTVCSQLPWVWMVSGGGEVLCPLGSIPVSQPFQIIGVDVENRHVLVSRPLHKVANGLPPNRPEVRTCSEALSRWV